MRTLLALPYLHLGLHEGAWPVLELQWLCYTASTDFRAAATQALELTQQHQVRAWVADDRRQGAIRPRDLEWAEQAIMVSLGAAGLRRFAQLEAQDALQRRTVDAMYTRIQPVLPFAVRRFEDLALARAWAGGGGEKADTVIGID